MSLLSGVVVSLVDVVAFVLRTRIRIRGLVRGLRAFPDQILTLTDATWHFDFNSEWPSVYEGLLGPQAVTKPDLHKLT